MLVKNGTAFIGGRFARADVRVENGKIAQIGDLQPREGEDVRSAAGLYVLPGFVDIHIHAYAGADCMRGENDVRRMSEGLLETGVAAFMPTTMSAPIEATHRALESIQRVKDHPCGKGAAVLGADTVVALDGRILGKPKDEEDAFEMLSALSGRVHEVFTGVCLLCPAGDAKEKTALRCARTLVEFETLSEAFIRAYIASGSPMDKAGAYGIQDGGLVRRIEGSYSNVVGLPLELLSLIHI